MSQQITTKDVDIQFRRYVKACEALELVPAGERVCMSTGSKLNGIAFRVFTVTIKPGNYDRGDHRPPAGYDYLGHTRREAYDKLAERSAVLEDVARAQKVNR